MRQAPQEVVSLVGPVGRAAREERRGRGRALLALRCHRWDLRPTEFEMAAVLPVYPEPVGEWRVGRSAPHPLGLTAAGWIGACAAAFDAASAMERWNSFSCCCGVAGTELAVLGALGADVVGVELPDTGSTARRRSESMVHRECRERLGMPGIPGTAGPAGPAAGGTSTGTCGAGGVRLRRPHRPCRGRWPGGVRRRCRSLRTGACQPCLAGSPEGPEQRGGPTAGGASGEDVRVADTCLPESMMLLTSCTDDRLLADRPGRIRLFRCPALSSFRPEAACRRSKIPSRSTISAHILSSLVDDLLDSVRLLVFWRSSVLLRTS